MSTTPVPVRRSYIFSLPEGELSVTVNASELSRETVQEVREFLLLIGEQLSRIALNSNEPEPIPTSER